MKCPDCDNEIGLKYIREFMRDKDISKSELGQWVHDELPNSFYWMDVDGVIYKRTTKTLRIIEEKKYGQGLKSSQKAILPMLAMCIDHLIEQEIISAQSGIFIVYTEPPYSYNFLHQVFSDGELSIQRCLSKSELIGLIAGEPIDMNYYLTVGEAQYIQFENPNPYKCNWIRINGENYSRKELLFLLEFRMLVHIDDNDPLPMLAKKFGIEEIGRLAKILSKE